MFTQKNPGFKGPVKVTVDEATRVTSVRLVKLEFVTRVGGGDELSAVNLSACDRDQS